MILINNQWEQIKDLSDIVRIAKENIGDEFAREIEKICGEPSLELRQKISELEDKVDELNWDMVDYDAISDSLGYLNKRLDKLKKYINKNKDGTDFMEGMIKAYEMIER